VLGGGGERKGSFAANARQGVGVLYRLHTG
jgi:hypothetical protein